MAALRLLVGAYGKPPSLRLATRDSDGAWTSGGAAEGVRNASFGVWSRRHRKLYVVCEEERGEIQIVEFCTQGWRAARTVPSGGAEPCHCALDASESFLAVANYGSGSVTLFTLDGEGFPRQNPWRYVAAGHGPNPERQAGPHAHWVGFSPDQRWLLAVDLGTDQVRSFPFDAHSGTVGEPRTAFRAPPGSGPRWLAFHPDGRTAFLVSELASTATTLSFRDGGFEFLHRCSTLPPGFNGESIGGHLIVTAAGTSVYVTNRGHDSIALLRYGHGVLSPVQWIASGGQSPRFLTLIDERTLLAVGHEKEGPIRLFEVVEEGRLNLSGAELPIEKVAWLEEEPAPGRSCVA